MGGYTYLLTHKWKIREWDFSPFTRKIMGQLPAPIIPGVEWTWKAEVWDPNVAKPKPQFSSPALPTWMWWGDEGTLHALAPVSTRPGLYELDVNAVYTVGDTELSTTRHMEVEVLAPGGAPPPATSNGSQGPSAAAVLSGGAAGTATSLAIPSPVTALDYAALVAQLGPESISALYASNFMAAARDGADSSM
ncbi:hypothetical protein BC828DRAFT_60866 [Blastocladiella britannica]|nr:hypothetical protein BC828DRAFT_60866 [Blastocladiella britannica]